MMLKLQGLVERLLMNQELTKILTTNSVNELRSVENPVDENDPIVHEAEETPVPELNEGQNVLLNSCLN